MKRQTRELERRVRERTREVEQANLELRWLALHDRLTNLRNRHYMYEIMPDEMTRLHRRTWSGDDANGGFGLALVDLDHFKEVNDQWDHSVGDQALRAVAEAFRDATRTADVVARWGGEEFLVLLRDVRVGYLPDTVQRLLEAVRQLRVPAGSSDVRLTCSIGYTHFPGHVPVATYTWEDVVRIADVALYLAKAEGRDRAVGLTYDLATPPAELMASLRSDVHRGEERGLLRRIEPASG